MAKTRHKGVVAAVFYAFTSVATVFLNKAIFRVHHFKLPATLVCGQTAFTLFAILFMRNFGIIKMGAFNAKQFKKVFVLSALFLLKLILDMSALRLVNIPMYGVLKSATTPCVMFLDYVLRKKHASRRVQLAVYMITMGGIVAGYGDLTFDVTGYFMALASAMSTACYVVVVGKLGEEAQMDSFSMLMYNCMWSLPMSLGLVLVTGEWRSISTYPHFHDRGFQVAYMTSCASALVLNYSTYWCTLLNDSLTTSVVGRTKSVVQGGMGLFAFGDVVMSTTNTAGLGLNSMGILWYAYEKYQAAQAGSASSGKAMKGLPSSTELDNACLQRDDSQICFTPRSGGLLGAGSGIKAAGYSTTEGSRHGVVGSGHHTIAVAAVDL
eukprot:CAMPEP_0182886858 /NCGR_PEP_ID=MMETSP0034_2-20130328/20467_1 /TAXON_ID=156128 /ORGANISM="Nephroselmis pyriformis, Strain CCMP717" /LENGTH=379 /DNA_ID=CAMNT_0025020199 /DNA_START=132 /DNA_END=1271 /DNA_ORIENTATION=-